MSFIDNIQTNLSLFIAELVVGRESDVTGANAMEFIHLKIECSSMYLTISLVLVNFQLNCS